MKSKRQLRHLAGLLSLLLCLPFLQVMPEAEAVSRPGSQAKSPAIKVAYRSKRSVHRKSHRRYRRRSPRRTSSNVPAPQDLVGQLRARTISPGVVYKTYRGSLSINVLDIDMVNAPVAIRSSLAGHKFDNLSDVKHQATKHSAIAAVNANYFKRPGIPLGTMIMNGEWIAGSLYDRVALGVNEAGFVRVDRVNLHGNLETSNPGIPCYWVNNVNQPRRTGARLIVYTRRWGEKVQIPYEGTLIAVDSRGRVVNKATKEMAIPPGGYVLSDRKDSRINLLVPGDTVKLSWHPRPKDWDDVVHAVSGGPLLIKDGNFVVDLKSEMFRKSWNSDRIHARTAAGVTQDNHLLLVTIEGPHTLWNLTKFLHKLGAVDALNLDGGGSTTMVVNGQTVTRNGKSHERRVASSLVVVPDPARFNNPEISDTERGIARVLTNHHWLISGSEIREGKFN